MKIAAYTRTALRQAFAAMRSAPLLASITILSVAAGLLLSGLALLAAQNARALLASWGEAIQLTVFFEPQAAAGRAAAVAEGLRRIEGVDRVRFVTPAEALQRLREGMGAKSPLLEGVEEDFLPPSLEVTFKRGHEDPSALAALADRVRKMEGVEEVETMGDWVRRLASAAELLRVGALLAAILSGALCLYLIGATIKLAVFARREEIEILKLVGATDRYVRAPFWIEGLFQGALGALLGAGGLALAFRFVAPRAEALLGGVLGGVHLTFLPPLHLLAGIGAAALLGLVSSHLAVRRHLHV